MPKLCKMCYNQLETVLDKDKFKLIFITQYNYQNYANIPNYIIEKLESGCISLTAFSDVLRQALISQNGGIWVDSTVWFESTVNKFFLIDTDFWSVKLERIDDRSVLGQRVSECKWSGFIISGGANNLICSFVYDAMCEYFRKHNCVIDYFLQNFLIKIAYNEIPGAKHIIDRIDYSNAHIYDLFRNMNKEYSDEIWAEMTNSTSIFKLTHKHNYLDNINGKNTVYSYLKNRVTILK